MLNPLRLIDKSSLRCEVWAKVESREAIKPRPSQLDLDVRISTHLAPDILSLRFYSCDDSHGSFHVMLQGF
jgi:hypothetical protein